MTTGWTAGPEPTTWLAMAVTTRSMAGPVRTR